MQISLFLYQIFAMDLSLFLDPLDDQFKRLVEQDANFGQSVFQYFHKLPDLDGMHLALIGLVEVRGSETQSSGFGEAADQVRRELYKLQKGNGAYKIADLGNLRNGPTLEDTLQRIEEVGKFLLMQGVLPIFFGGTHDLTLGQMRGHGESSQRVNLLVVDSTFDLQDAVPDQSHLRQLIGQFSDNLFQVTHLGHQSYLVNEELFAFMESLKFESIRIGMVKERLREMEPLIRDADLMSFDLSSLNQQFAPGAPASNPYGLSGEEACQVCWYAGLNDKLTSVGFYGIDGDLDDAKGTTAFVNATMIWYFIEGYYHRTNDRDFQSPNFLIYEVSMQGEPASIRFFKSKRSEKWWMEVPNAENENSIFLRNKMVPCSYEDYENALTGEVPSRWLSAFARLN